MTDHETTQSNETDLRLDYEAPELTVLDANKTEGATIPTTPEVFAGTQS